MKGRKLNGALWRFLKQCFGSRNALENVETKEAKWCIRTLFEECGPMSFRGAIECGNMFITEITLNKTIRYNVKLLASRCFFITPNIRFLNTPVYLQTLEDMTYSLNCISSYTTIYTVCLICLGCCYGGYFPVSLP